MPRKKKKVKRIKLKKRIYRKKVKANQIEKKKV